MISNQSHRNIAAWSFVSPETFELTVRRLVQPGAEEKLREALAAVTLQMEEAERSPLAEARARFHQEEKLRKKREKLERQLEKLQELKSKAAGPLIGGLFLGGIVWIIILAGTGTGVSYGVSAIANSRLTPIEAAIEEDKKGVEERKGSGLTIEELIPAVSVGQLIGIPAPNAEGTFVKDENDEWPKPEFLSQITGWTPELSGCVETLSQIAYAKEFPGCVAAARLDLVKADDPSITMSCVYLQLGTEYGPSSATSKSSQESFGKEASFLTQPPGSERVVRYWVQDPTNDWDETTMLFCQLFGSTDVEVSKRMGSSVAQIGLRVDAGFYAAGGIFVWLESDGSYAPRSVWDGNRPND